MKIHISLIIIFLIFISLTSITNARIDVTSTNINALPIDINNTINIVGGGDLSISISNFSYGASDGIYVNTSMYGRNTTTGAANWNSPRSVANNATQSIINSHQYAIRQTGVIEYVEFDTVCVEGLTSYKINIWRQNGTNYDLVAQTPNLRSQMINGFNNISVNLNVHEGDFIGESCIGSGGPVTGAMYAAPGGTTRYYYGYDPIIGGANGISFNWTKSGITSTPYTHTILTKMQSPNIVFIGDSICAGHPKHFSYTETAPVSNLMSSYPYWFGLTGNVTYQNMAIGGQTTSQIASRFSSDVVALHPTYVIIEGGVNDVAAGAPSEAILDNYETMLNICNKANIEPIIVLILPWRAGSVTNKQRIDYLNDQLIIKASKHDCRYIDCRDTIGYYSESIKSWNVDTVYNSDGIHFTPDGYAVLGKSMFDQFVNITIDDSHFNIYNSNWIPTDITDLLCINSSVSYLHADVNIYRKNVMFSAIPSNGKLTINITEWQVNNDYKKMWTESSELHNITTRHIIGGFPEDTTVYIKRDEIQYTSVKSNETGFINWVYTDEYSSHTFIAYISTNTIQKIQYEFANFFNSIFNKSYRTLFQFSTRLI